MRDISLSAGEVPEPPGSGNLYHYTDAGGLLGILKDKALRASDVWFMNDTREARYAIERVRLHEGAS